MLKRKKSFIGIGLALIAGATLTGCGSAPVQTVAVGTDTVVVDVRTPAEYAEGHLDGAVNLDIQSADFAAQAAELDPEADYVLYCRSGNRAAAAQDYLADLGFADVENVGSLREAADATGLEIVS
ncbi:rhodanese-like domain-containing protein [Myceligenerans xiligouense]|uniref:Rhodanese-like domain-containing protein n=1 Tax=Myceligenerans xiligouense TaxID=253184 RepID=A0A3N4YKV3_9MICO|nr:rhodanese-like domain-containing protein [Myceligenerans xiligouense]RPF21353.1 rhodanese-like domain-containing protein [Myceligenerans xiligouense]